MQPIQTLSRGADSSAMMARLALLLQVLLWLVFAALWAAHSWLGLMSLNWMDQAIPSLSGVLALGWGLWAWRMRREDAAGLHLMLLGGGMAAWLVSVPSADQGWQSAAYILELSVIAACLANLGWAFPHPLSSPAWARRLAWLPWLISALMVGASWLASLPSVWFVAWATLAGAGMVLVQLLQALRSRSPRTRAQARLAVWGVGLGLLPPLAWQLADSWGQALDSLAPAIWLLPVLLTLFFTDALRAPLRPAVGIGRSGWITILTAFGFTAIFSGVLLWLDAALPWTAGLLIFLLLLISLPMRDRLLQRLEGGQPFNILVLQDQLSQFIRDLPHAQDIPSIVACLERAVMPAIPGGQLQIYVYDPASEQFTASGLTSTLASDLRFMPSSPLVQTLRSLIRKPLTIDDLQDALVGQPAEQARLNLLNAKVFLPLPGRYQLSGFLALTPAAPSIPADRLEYLLTLCDHTALALERAQVAGDLEQRVEELNVMTRLAQGINITLRFDDLLELVYAQSARLAPADHMTVALLEPYGDDLMYAFFLVGDERLTAHENRPLPPGRGLEWTVLQSHRPLLTDEYETECRRRSVLPVASNLHAWIGVPLNAGAETIGVLSMGSMTPGYSYSSDDLRLLEAITDQAAGAIVKARLLQETEQRTRQLATLNEVARDLGSTLDLDLLLNRILNAAVEILDCQAGTLFLVDEETRELIFQVTSGPVAGDLVGRRLPPGTGLVGRAVDMRKPLVANDVLKNKDWFNKPDQQTGFHTESLLVAPMLVKDQVVGVIEVINKTDGRPFVAADQELLTAFAAQAAVAYENARLYTRTDQALAGKVEELSVMQRIDRELNASLDVARAMRITLDWAMRQTGAEAGWVGQVHEDSLLNMASTGYAPTLAALQGETFEASLPVIERARQSGSVQASDGPLSSGAALLPAAQSQVAAPIRRETQVIGVMLLESTRPGLGSEETLGFLARLSDHASIAISNAQLYSAVQQANQAKSDFVSMVSHELKTPMTSIRGYADLIAAGAVGPINEAQSNFLTTIRSNVERMQTLVSDLADVARIEAGRLRLDFRAVQIDDVVEEVTRSAQAQLNEKQQELLVNVNPGLPPVWADRGRIVQVLTNLLSNAIKYSPEEATVTLNASLTANQWNSEGAPQVVLLSVQDTGYGITPADQKRIFQKFFRADDQEVRNASGTGLGLNITRTLVEMQGGRIWFESEFRKGTTFSFTVPVAAAGSDGRDDTTDVEYRR